MTTHGNNYSRYTGTLLKAVFYVTLAVIFVLALVPEPDKLPEVTKISDKLNHIAAFAVLGVLIDAAFTQRNLLWKIPFLLIYGFAIECAQYFVPSREFSLFDLAADSLGFTSYFALRAVAKNLSRHHAKD